MQGNALCLLSHVWLIFILRKCHVQVVVEAKAESNDYWPGHFQTKTQRFAIVMLSLSRDSLYQ